MYYNSERLYLGIDGGGTKCKAVLIDDYHSILGIGVAGAGNPVYGLQKAKNSIVESALKALEAAQRNIPKLSGLQLNNIPAGLGLAGVNIPAFFSQIADWESPFHSQYLTTDLSVACLGAHNGTDGAVIVSGTGTCGFATVAGESFMLGGHGFPQGDKGSGAWFGMRAVQSVLLSMDRLGPQTRITHHLFNHLNTQSANDIISYVATKSPSKFAGLAHCVFQAAVEQDAIAQTILDEGVGYLENMADSLLAHDPPRLSFIGGMADTIKEFLSSELQEKLAKPIHPPEVGAALFAKNSIAK
ncbi:ATPase [Alteromonas pelagimontana]|uniref:ATPase n=1 Tax=Alteromonas pelagimontana TaxID=1858656 RepID=A0A6M4MF19_9ALTE|nr:BadF/BadG/BcrA/BcrD ATPase family protein [Alteromonas pelagimontana]QJR81702.1 ATPase [Alteromonas pelagimontana]